MRDWYGQEEASAVISSRRRPAQHVGDAVDAVVREMGLARDLLLEELVQHWQAVVGPDVARRSVPSEIQGKTLIVEVADSSWMFILRAQHRQSIVAELARFSESKISDVRFVPQGRIRREPR
jgi:predicted nucleic acid-binding Zn ribbon protein